MRLRIALNSAPALTTWSTSGRPAYDVPVGDGRGVISRTGPASLTWNSPGTWAILPFLAGERRP